MIWKRRESELGLRFLSLRKSRYLHEVMDNIVAVIMAVELAACLVDWEVVPQRIAVELAEIHWTDSHVYFWPNALAGG